MSNISNLLSRARGNFAPLVMGVLNVSRDSFSDGGKYSDDASAVARAAEMLREGADIIDIGAESTRPDATALSAEDELALLLPRLKAVRAAFADVPISVDTYKGEVARIALENGADIVNDVFVKVEGGHCATAAAAAEFGCPIVLTHNCRGESGGGDFFASLVCGLGEKISAAEAEGVPRENIVLDPGFGFGKTVAQNFEAVARLGELRVLGCPILLGVSRKSSLGAVVGGDMDLRDDSTAAVSALATFAKSVDILRVHNVAKNVAAIKTASEILKWTK